MSDEAYSLVAIVSSLALMAVLWLRFRQGRILGSMAGSRWSWVAALHRGVVAVEGQERCLSSAQHVHLDELGDDARTRAAVRSMVSAR